MEKRCFLIGNRDVDEKIVPALGLSIIDHIENKGVLEFIVGQYGNFDRIAAKTLVNLKAKYPHIILTLLLPYHPGDHPINISKDFDSIYYPFEKPIPPRFAIVQANKTAICSCSYLIACVNHPGKARDFLKIALSREKKGLIHVDNIGNMSDV